MKDINKFFSSLCHRHCGYLEHFTELTVLVMPLGDEKLQFSGFPLTSLSNLTVIFFCSNCVHDS